MEKPIVNKKVKLEKFEGKGGWTYARLPEVKPDKKSWFNWVKVKGTIDNFEIKAYNLMSMGNGQLFLPVKKEIRKKINKEAGNYVTVKLYLDNDPLEIPAEFLDCLRDDPVAHKNFFACSESVQKQFLDWIYSAKKDETRINRMAEAINRCSAPQFDFKSGQIIF